MLHGSRAIPGLLARVAGPSVPVSAVGGWEELLAAAPRLPPDALLVVDPYFASGRTLAPELQLLLARFPSLAVMAAIDGPPSTLDDVRQLGVWGVAQILNLQHETSTPAIAHRLRTAQERTLRTSLLDALPQVSDAVRDWIASALDTITSGGNPEAMARGRLISVWSLRRRMRRDGLPPPATLLRWMKLLFAARLLDDAGRTVLEAALMVGYNSDAALLRALRAQGLPATRQLRGAGAFRTVAHAFAARLRGKGAHGR